jgi:hypothetical protein
MKIYRIFFLVKIFGPRKNPIASYRKFNSLNVQDIVKNYVYHDGKLFKQTKNFH